MKIMAIYLLSLFTKRGTHMSKALIEYELKTSLFDTFVPYGEGKAAGNSITVNFGRSSDSNILRRQNEDTNNNSQSQDTWVAEIQDEAVGGIDFEEKMKELDPDARQREQARVDRLLDQVKQWDGKKLHPLTEIVAEYVSTSELFNEPHALMKYLEKLKRTLKAFEEFNSANEGRELDEEDEKEFKGLKRKLKKIWGEKLRIKTTSTQSLADAFTGFQDVLDGLNEKTPPFNFETKVSYNLNVKKLQLPGHIRKSLRRTFGPRSGFSGYVPYWQLPAELFKIQENLLGSLPETLPDYRICLDGLGDKDTSYRLTFDGNTVEELVDGIRQKFEEHRTENEADAPQAYQATVHSYKDQNGFFAQSAIFQDHDSLFNTIRDQIAMPSAEDSRGQSAKFLPK